MLCSSKKLLLKIIIGIVALISLTVMLNFSYMIFRLFRYGVGKPIEIEIQAEEVIDWSQVDRGAIDDEYWFDSLNDYSRNQLINYMKKENLCITPGIYYLNSSSDFNTIKDIFNFEKLKQN